MLPLTFSSLRQRVELALGRLAQSSVGKLLHAVGDGADQQVPAQSWRLASIEPAPLVAQLLCRQLIEDRNSLRQLMMSVN